MPIVILKRGDTKGKFTDTLMEDGVAIPLTGCSVKFLLRHKTKPELSVVQDATIVSAPTGQVEYQPVPADVANAGEYDQEWEIKFPSDQVITVPNRDFNTVKILRDLGGVQGGPP